MPHKLLIIRKMHVLIFQCIPLKVKMTLLSPFAKHSLAVEKLKQINYHSFTIISACHNL